jgi:hypothetical protein
MEGSCVWGEKREVKAKNSFSICHFHLPFSISFDGEMGNGKWKMTNGK